MDTEHICPSCRKPLPAGAPQGLCPECLMKAGFGSGVAPEPGQPSRTPPFVPPSAAELARLFPQFEIMELLGQGGMGAVYKARQPALDRQVALKVLPPETGADTGFADRFTREARALAKLSHPNIVGVHEFGQAGGLHYFVMEYVEGLNLRQLQQAGRLSPREALKIIPQICDALQFAHDEGIVHRDIKPENVMLDRKGRVKITDFGLAKILGREPTTVRLTGAKDVMGTPHYMAPEQIEHPQEVDHRADIYSLGVVFYEMLTGELPLGKFQAPSRKVQVDVRLDEVVLHALEKEPERRYQQASQVKTDVETIASTAPKMSMPAQDSPRPAHPPVLGPTQHQEPRFTADSVQQQFMILAVSWWIGYSVSIVSEFGDWLNVISLPAIIVATVFWCILLYRHWSLLQGHGARTTPGKAVGYGFIPIFWFYWWFVAYAGLATDNNRYLRQIGISARRMSFGLAVTSCILGCLLCTVGWFPVGWAVLIVPYMIIGFILVVQQRDCVLAMLEHRAQVRGAGEAAGEARPMAPEASWAGGAGAGVRSAAGQASASTGAAGRAMEEPPRMSRAAIGGAVWAPLFLVAVLLVFLACRVVLPHGPVASVPLWLQLLQGGALPGPTWLQALLSLTFLPLGLTAPFGTTILGGVAISQIRHSQGRLYGLGLAVFDVLLFPLLALNGGLIIGWCWLADQVGPEWIPQLGRGWFSVLIVGLMVTNCAVASWLMTMAVWRAANRGPGGGAIALTAGASAPRSRGSWGTVVTVAGVTLLFAVLAGMFSLALYHYSKRQPVTTYDGKNAFAVQQKLLREVVRHLETANYRWERLTVAIHYFVNPDVAECKIEGLRKLVNKELPDGPAAQQVDALSGGLDIRHTGDGVWTVRGSGGLAKIRLLVDARAEMGPIRRQVPLFTKLFGFREPAGPPPATSLPQDGGKSRAAARSLFPKPAHIGRNDCSVMIHHDDVDLHYALFYAGDFDSSTSDTHNSRSKAWTDDGSLKLKNGRTFGYRRESPRPDHLHINGTEYNLRQGRVFALSDDGTMAQMALFPPLEVARDPQQLAGLVASSDASLRSVQAKPGEFKVSLTNGLEFEVVAVASSPRSGSVWWRPDGTLLPDAPGDRLGAFPALCPNPTARAEFALLTRRAGEFVPEAELLLAFEPRPHYVTCTELYQGGQAKGRVTLIGFRDVVPGSLICEIGLADGAWERVATWDQAGVVLKNESGSTVRLIRSGADGQTCLKLDHNLDPRKFALRLAARLKNGENKTARLCRVEYAGLQNVHTCSLIQNLEDSEVVAYELYRLPLRWARVPGIATRPAMPPLEERQAAATLGPEKEVVLTEFNNRDGQEALDLDSGKVHKQPKDMDQWSEAGFVEWVTQNGIDVLVDQGPGNRWGLMTILPAELRLARVWNEKWAGIGLEELLAALTNSPLPLEVVDKGDFRIVVPPKEAPAPVTLAFKTSAGGLGLLQIAGLTDKPRGVRIRYKLVQTPSETARLEDLSEADRARAVAIFNDIEDFGDEFTAAFTSKNLPAAETGTRRLFNLLSNFNTVVKGTGYEFSPVLFEDIGKLHQALKEGDWDKVEQAARYNHAYGSEFKRAADRMVELARQQQQSAAAGFGPVVERVIAGAGDKHKRFIDLDKGRLFAAAEYFGPKAEPSPEETQKWLQETGIDAVADTRSLYGGLVGFNMVASPVPTEEWDRLPPSRLDYYLAMSTPGTPVVMSGKGELPATYAVKTREGGKGLLQILSMTTNKPPEVRIRYKLVQPAKQ